MLRSKPTCVLMVAATIGVSLPNTVAVARGGHGGGFHGGHHGIHGSRTAAPVYLVVDIATITDADVFKAAMEKASAAVAGFGGRVVVDNDHATAIEGTPPGRLVMIAFDDPERERAWAESPDGKAFDAARRSATTSRVYTIEGLRAPVQTFGAGGHGHGIGFDPKPFEDIIKRRDQVLEKVKSICKGC